MLRIERENGIPLIVLREEKNKVGETDNVMLAYLDIILLCIQIVKKKLNVYKL